MATPHRIPLLTATAIVVANMVGTGVFTSLGYQVGGLPSGFVILFLWTLGGFLSFCGAVCYAELGSMMPRSGGEYHYLRQAWHPFVGFLGGWVSATVGFAVPIAAAAVAMGGYLEKLTGHAEWKLASAILTVALIALLHCGNLRHTGRFQVAFTLGKVALILVFIGAGLFQASPQAVAFAPRPGDGALVATPAFAVSLVYVMYSYAGWNAAAYIVGEMENPRRDLPLALLFGTGFVALLYVLLNAVFFRSAPMDELKASGSEVALVAARHVFGERGGFLMGCAIAFGLVSTISSMTWAGPRVMQVMGQDFGPFRFLSRTNRHGVPWVAILSQTVVVLPLLVFGVDTLFLYVQLLLNLSSALVVAGLLALRWREPDAPRPYRAWGYPFTPLLFLAASVWMTVHQARQHPVESAWGLLTLVAGAAIWLLGRPRSGSRPSEA